MESSASASGPASPGPRPKTPGQTIQATALVHEAYLRLVDVERAQHWNRRGHFFAAAAEAIRRILVDRARRRRRLKRGGDALQVNLEGLDDPAEPDVERLVALDRALDKFREEDPAKARLVQLRFFAGLTIEQAAKAMRVSTSTADRHWAYARAWLRREMASQADG